MKGLEEDAPDPGEDATEAATVSIAISLKRIADRLDRICGYAEYADNIRVTSV